MKNEQTTLDMTRDQWLEARRHGIGGSDAGAILGKNKWKSPLDVYQDKKGSSVEIPDNEAMYWGRNLEDLDAKEYEIRSGNKIRRNNRIVKHPDHDFIIANSSYSWWGAWLNENPDKICLRPANINPSNNKNFWPENWIVI